jgi:deoxyribodipyrimidine photo-lyase
MSSIFWFRRDLRLQDHPALNSALASGDRVFLVATADLLGRTFDSLSDVRKNSLRASWLSLSKSLDGRLTIVEKPSDVVGLATATSSKRVFVSAAYDTNGRKELLAIQKDLASVDAELVIGPGNYAVEPGNVLKSDGTPYRVYTPFFNEWSRREVTAPHVLGSLDSVQSVIQSNFEAQLELANHVSAGEVFASRTLDAFLANRVDDYSDNRNRADLGGTSHLSHALSHGEIHPRTILAKVPLGSPGALVFRKEIAWREFYADVLFNWPHSLDNYLDPKYANMRYDNDSERFQAWKDGKTGYPMVDAGMRQLAQTGWMHNRVRMIVASFLIKDLHMEWQQGAEWFEENLTDFDPASNSHGWQWTAGCGTDASPYYRVFNPVMQGLKFDPNGNYVRKYVPELRHLSGSDVHEPWELSNGYELGYPPRIVDHAAERIESLARLEELKNH